MRMAWVLAGLLSFAAARAEDAGTPPKAPDAAKAPGVPQGTVDKPAPDPSAKPQLSREDAELIKDLALLERIDLLRNLELFEPEPQGKQTKEERP
jgi:hypothetical protein